MKLTLKHRHHQPSESFTALIRNEMESLQTRMRIDEARVVVERHEEASPPFRISAHLITPGPDVTAEAQDHTLRAALGKLLRAISGKIGHRARRQSRRQRSRIGGRAVPSLL